MASVSSSCDICLCRQSLRECFNCVRRWHGSALTAPKLSTHGSFEAVQDLSLRRNSKVRADEAIFDKISMSAFEGTPSAMALRDCGLISFMICGIATEIGIDPTVRHGADLGLIPIVIEDACGHGHRSAAERSMENIRFNGDAFVTNVKDLR